MALPERPSWSRAWPWLLGLGWGILDQAAKLAVVSAIPPHHGIPLIPGLLDLVHAHNRGAAFGLLNEGSGWQVWLLSGVAVAVIAALSVWLSRLGPSQSGTRLALALILGGAVGNLADRLRLGYVVDFIDVHWQDVYHYPAFNLADSGITLGALLLIIIFVREERAAARSERSGS